MSTPQRGIYLMEYSLIFRDFQLFRGHCTLPPSSSHHFKVVPRNLRFFVLTVRWVLDDARVNALTKNNVRDRWMTNKKKKEDAVVVALNPRDYSN